MKRVLVLGAGLVSRPLVDDLLDRRGYEVLVADREFERAEALVAGRARGEARPCDASDPASLEALCARADLVVSLLPYAFHPAVARAALAHKIPLVTTSYVSPAMAGLDAEAQGAGILLLNEIGLDPGIDHMSAMRVVRAAAARGERVVSFTSCCGGLPAPEADTNPWGYKFSWSPRGVLLAGRSGARWLEDGRIVEIPEGRLFEFGRPYRFEGIGDLEMVPNRDSLAYVRVYGLEDARTVLRGTIRHPGWCETLRAVTALGLLELEPVGPPTRWTRESASRRLGDAATPELLDRLEWAGIFDATDPDAAPVAPLDRLAALLEPRMAYAPGERDMVLLRHVFDLEKHGRRRRIVSRLRVFGEPDGDSAMSRTVAFPAAIAARSILEGRLPLTGVRIPVDPSIADPVLDELADVGIAFEEEEAEAEA